MTFFSSAARIWSQGFSAVAGEVANAIVLSLLLPLAGSQSVQSWFFRQRLPPGAKQRASNQLTTDYLMKIWSAPQDSTSGRLNKKSVTKSA
jgi:hypothetical protein